MKANQLTGFYKMRIFWPRTSVFIIDFEYIQHIVFMVNFEQLASCEQVITYYGY